MSSTYDTVLLAGAVGHGKTSPAALAAAHAGRLLSEAIEEARVAVEHGYDREGPLKRLLAATEANREMLRQLAAPLGRITAAADDESADARYRLGRPDTVASALRALAGGTS